ncbi:MAG: DNA translocase FtsK 4TM domain-containing protein, partial [Alphaproteobacteria bacterium]|nr:DNA translocase FtsK 4TM domain-containing protein [Alphaproteobacteria bacterium]
MAAAKKGVGKGGFLPKGAADALWRLAARLGGLALIVTAALIAAALVTADPRDPSFNNAVDGPVRNALGRVGASIADLLGQLVGLASWVAVAVALIWGLRTLIRARAPSLWATRIVALPVVVLLWALALAALPLPAPDVIAGSGGAYGAISADPVGGRVIKCDQCGGDPACVSACPSSALEWGSAG